ncbi:MAG TPA: phosphoribosylanthranilate isomerase [Novosphingobium sp.]|nr:phosphoribosylanthranilate isomerase [Novosphingobium sp.]
MTGPAIKICGISAPDTLEAAIAARADHVGFVFFPRSPRALTPREAAPLGDRARGRVGRVGPFVDADDALIAEAVAAAGLDAIQLQGAESPARAAEVKARFGLPVWKALAVAAPGDADKARSFAGAVDLVLFDARTPKGTLPGGMGLSFDWNLVARWNGPVAWGLAGGLNPANVAEAVQLTGTALVDTSSGVESAPGTKDAGLIAAFCKAARSI